MSRVQLVAWTFSTCTALLVLPTSQIWREQAPAFEMYGEGEVRKLAFFSYLGALIDAENASRLTDRQRLSRLTGAVTTKRDALWIESLERRYGIFEATRTDRIETGQADRIARLLTHVDVVPRSLALAQSAKESAWGTSRFAVEGNNFFGQRCYEKGCGMVPEARPANARFEVQRFDTVAASVASYMHNINSHRQYLSLREYRAECRRQGVTLSGIQLAERITQYSERRQAYVDEIQSLIHFNQLEKPP